MGLFENFKEFLDNNNYKYEVGPSDEDYNRIILTDEIRNVGRIAIYCRLDVEEKYILVDIYNIAKITSPLKRDELLRLINTLNGSTIFGKYIVTEDGDVILRYSMIDPDRLNYDHFMALLGALLTGLKEDHISKFMKLQWA